jgi:hypothetical protein
MARKVAVVGMVNVVSPVTGAGELVSGFAVWLESEGYLEVDVLAGIMQEGSWSCRLGISWVRWVEKESTVDGAKGSILLSSRTMYTRCEGGALCLG